MIFFLTKRIVYGFISIFLVVTAVFFISRLTGSPADLYLPIDTSEQVKRDFEVLHGFNKPLTEQYYAFLSDITKGDLGDSLRLNVPAIRAISEAIPGTLYIAAIVIPIALFMAILIGTIAALKPNGIFDRVASSLSLAAASIPEFWLALLAILIFSVWLRILPSSGYDGVIYWVMPVGILIIKPLGALVQVIRSALSAALSSPYCKTAYSKGASSIRIILVHCLRNAMIPIVTMLSDSATNIINGVVIIEIMFGFPGLGRLMLDSVIFRDYELLQAIVIVTAFLVFAITTITDLLYVLLDPRVRNE